MKIDTTKIEGFDAMSTDDKLSALLNLEVADERPAVDENKYKSLLSRANAEAAEYKRKWQSTLSEQEKADAERAEKDREKDNLIAQLTRETTVSTYKSTYLAMGYSDELAAKSAEAFIDRNIAEVVAIQKSHEEAVKKQWEANALNHQPQPTGGSPLKGAEDLDKLSDADYYKNLFKR